MKNSGKHLIVLSGPSGSGKDTVVQRLVQQHPEIKVSISATTRAMRPGEAQGVNYYYMTKAAFQQKLAQGEILEHTCYCGNYYGTPKAEVDNRLAAGENVVLVIEVEGAANVRRLYPEAKLVFVQPPSFEELERRLRGRGTESEEAIAGRLARAKAELSFSNEYNYVLLNDTLDQCVAELYRIITE
ncbi:MAG: guanylate kinase [Pygmaiobacter sp.]